MHHETNHEVATSIQATVTQLRVVAFVGPSEIRDAPEVASALTIDPTRCGVDIGTWPMFDPQPGRWGEGGFGINANIRLAEATGGQGTTPGMMEGKADRPAYSPAGLSPNGGTLSLDRSHAGWVNDGSSRPG